MRTDIRKNKASSVLHKGWLSLFCISNSLMKNQTPCPCCCFFFYIYIRIIRNKLEFRKSLCSSHESSAHLLLCFMGWMESVIMWKSESLTFTHAAALSMVLLLSPSGELKAPRCRAFPGASLSQCRGNWARETLLMNMELFIGNLEWVSLLAEIETAFTFPYLRVEDIIHYCWSRLPPIH